MIKLKQILLESHPLTTVDRKILKYIQTDIANELRQFANMDIVAKDVKIKVDGNKLIVELPTTLDSLWKGKFSVKLSDKDLGKFVQQAKDAGIDTEWRGNTFIYTKTPDKLSDFFEEVGIKHMILKNGKGIKVQEKR
jgi:hypothetical protein